MARKTTSPKAAKATTSLVSQLKDLNGFQELLSKPFIVYSLEKDAGKIQRLISFAQEHPKETYSRLRQIDIISEELLPYFDEDLKDLKDFFDNCVGLWPRACKKDLERIQNHIDTSVIDCEGLLKTIKGTESITRIPSMDMIFDEMETFLGLMSKLDIKSDLNQLKEAMNKAIADNKWTDPYLYLIALCFLQHPEILLAERKKARGQLAFQTDEDDDQTLKCEKGITIGNIILDFEKQKLAAAEVLRPKLISQKLSRYSSGQIESFDPTDRIILAIYDLFRSSFVYSIDGNDLLQHKNIPLPFSSESLSVSRSDALVTRVLAQNRQTENPTGMRTPPEEDEPPQDQTVQAKRKQLMVERTELEEKWAEAERLYREELERIDKQLEDLSTGQYSKNEASRPTVQNHSNKKLQKSLESSGGEQMTSTERPSKKRSNSVMWEGDRGEHNDELASGKRARTISREDISNDAMMSEVPSYLEDAQSVIDKAIVSRILELNTSTAKVKKTAPKKKTSTAKAKSSALKGNTSAAKVKKRTPKVKTITGPTRKLRERTKIDYTV